MKTNSKNTNLLIIAFCITMLISTASKAQALCSGYQIVNNTSCAINIDFNYYCLTPASGCAQSPSGGVTMTPGQTLTINGCGCTSCDITVTLNRINGSSTSLPVTVTSCSSTATYNSGLCPSNGTVTWTTNSTSID